MAILETPEEKNIIIIILNAFAFEYFVDRHGQQCSSPVMFINE